MKIVIRDRKLDMAKQAAADGAKLIRAAISERGEANIVVSTGASQFEMFEALVTEPDVAWNKVNAFHLDEYVKMPVTHPASFRLYLWRRFASKLPLPLANFYYLDAETDPEGACQRVSYILLGHPIDVAFVGIGENGHLAFNDPPADFKTEQPYIIVNLAEDCRRQQLGEGWFKTLEDVPRAAVTMSIRQITKSNSIICTVPDERKAKPVQAAIEGPVTNTVPASILQQHPRTTIYLDSHSASLLKSRA